MLCLKIWSIFIGIVPGYDIIREKVWKKLEIWMKNRKKEKKENIYEI